MNGKPNILFIMTDQQRADMVRSEGFSENTMPFLDQWALEGTRFRRAYTTSPLCVPARVSLLTGRYPKAHRVRDNYKSGADVYKPCPDLLDILKESGYRTALFGKNHTYLDETDFDVVEAYDHGGYLGNRPLSGEEQAFQKWLKSRGNMIMQEASPYSFQLQHPVRIVRDALDWLEESRGGETPFFLWVSFPEPHNPSQVSEPYYSMFDPPPAATDSSHARAKGGKWEWMSLAQGEWDPLLAERADSFRKSYCGMLRLIDDQIERLINAMKDKGLYENTIIVFTSDHGDYCFEYGLHGKGVGLPECLIRVPLIMAGPGIISYDNDRDFVSLADVFPSLCALIGAPSPRFVQGRDLSPLLKGEDYPASEFESIYAEAGVGDLHQDKGMPGFPDPGLWRGKSFFDGLNRVSMSGKTKMIRKGQFKLIADMMGNRELYDLDEDPQELENLSGKEEYFPKEAELMGELLRWIIRTEDDSPDGLYERYRKAHNWYS